MTKIDCPECHVQITSDCEYCPECGFLINYEEHSFNWNQLRRQVYHRANYVCEQCGVTNVEIHAHHVKPKSEGGSDELDNLKCLCYHCHMLQHPDNFKLIENCIEKYYEKLGVNYGSSSDYNSDDSGLDLYDTVGLYVGVAAGLVIIGIGIGLYLS